MSQQSDPVILQYDQPRKAAKPSRAVVIGFIGGLAIDGVFNGIAIFLLILYGVREYAFGPWLDALLMPAMWLAMDLVPVLLFLGLTVWLKTKIVKTVRFARMRTAVIWGLVGGAFSPVLLIVTAEKSESSMFFFALLFAWIAWNCLCPIVAGLFLCQRSALRE